MARFMSGMLFNSLHHRGIQDVKAALDYLVTRPEVDGERVGAIGFCMGGGFAVAWACTDDRLKAIAPFYGMNPRPLEAVRRACPVVGSYPERLYGKSGRKAGRGLDVQLSLWTNARAPANMTELRPGGGMVDAVDSKSTGATCAGSSPALGTISERARVPSSHEF